MAIGTEQVKKILLEMGSVMEQNKEYLTELDAAIGDGDHGINMNKGFKNAEAKLVDMQGGVVGDYLKVVAMALLSHVGGSAGPLYGTLFMKASAIAKDKPEVDMKDLCAMLTDGVAGIKMRGKSDKGEKTMLDVLIPALEALESGLAKNAEPKAALADALAAAKDGVEYTKTIKATKGRASYLGDRSIGHIDPGAMSSCLLINVIYDAL